jgi:hypothetical protein
MGQEITPMKREFKIGDHVEWNSEAGHVRGTIKKRVISAIKFKTYTVRASKEEPQYLIKSDKTDHMAMHKGAALTKIGKADARPRRIEPEEEMKHKKTCRRRNLSSA